MAKTARGERRQVPQSGGVRQGYTQMGRRTPFSLNCGEGEGGGEHVATVKSVHPHLPPTTMQSNHFLKRCDTGSCSVSATCAEDDMQWPKDGRRVLTCLCCYVRSSVLPATTTIAWPDGASPDILNRRTGGLLQFGLLGLFYGFIVASEVCHELTKKHTAVIRRTHRLRDVVKCSNWTRDPPTERSIFTSGQRRRGYKGDKSFLLALPRQRTQQLSRHTSLDHRDARTTVPFHLSILHSSIIALLSTSITLTSDPAAPV